MSVVDNRIVRMIFDNASFKRAAAETKQSLDHVNQAITNAGHNKGLLGLEKAMDGVAVKAGKMQVAVLTAVGTVANKVTNAAISAVNSLTLGPLKQGFSEYESLLTKQNVIMNATGKSATVVKKILNELNAYSDQTIYSFGDMTGAVTKFVNAGVSLPKSVTSIKGIANAAAFAGANSEEASRAMYAFSQSMGLGFIGLQDWMQIENANMGTVKFKQELINAAVATGDLTKKGKMYVTQSGKSLSATKGWRLGLQEQWATTEVLNKTLGKYADRTTELGEKAFQAATQVRTYTAFMGTLKEAIGSGWAQVFTALFGGLDEATTMWTSLSLAVGKVVTAFFGFITTSLTAWREMGGATKIAQGLKNILSPFVALFKAIGDAWKKAFPSTGKGVGAGLYGLSAAFELLTRPLTWLAKLITLLVHPLSLLFLLIKFGINVVKGIIGYLVDFAKAIWDVATFKTPSTGGFWDLVQDIGGWVRDGIDWLQKLIAKIRGLVTEIGKVDFKKLLPDMPDLGGFASKIPDVGGFSFSSLFGGEKSPGGDYAPISNTVANIRSLEGAGLQTAVANIRGLEGSDLKTAITNIRSLEGGDIKTAVTNIRNLEGGMGGLFTAIGRGVSNLRGLEDGLENVSDESNDGVSNLRGLEAGLDKLNDKTLTGVTNLRGLEGGLETVKEKGRSFWDIIKKIGTAIGAFFGRIEGTDIISSLNFAVLATMGVMFAKVLYSVWKILDGFSGLGKSVIGTINSVGDAFSSFQTAARAKLILNIGIAILLLAGALWLLSTIPEDKLKTAFKGLAGILAAFGVIMLMFSKTIKGLDVKDVGKMYALGFAFAAIGAGILLLAAAMLIMKMVGWNEIVKTMLILGTLFYALNIIGKLAGPAGRKIVAAAIAIGIIAGAMIILAGAMMLFKFVNPGDMIKVGISLAVMTAALVLLSFVPPGMLYSIGVAMLSLAIAMGILAVALIIFSKVNWMSIVKAAVVLTLLTAAIIAIAIFGGGPVGASAIIALAAGVMILALAMMVFNKVSWNAVAKGSVALLALIVAFALFMVVVYLAAPVIPLLTGLAFGLGVLAIGIALLVAALALILPLMAASIATFALFATAAAVAIAVFLQTLAAESENIKKSAIKIFQVFCDGIVESIPIILDTIKRVLKAIWVFFTGPPAAEPGKAGGDSIMRSLQKKLQEWTPKILDAIEKLVGQLVQKFHDNADNYAAAAVALLVAFIRGITSKVDDVVGAIKDLIVKILGAIGNQIEPIATAGADLIIAFINGMANTIKTKGPELGEAMGNLGVAMVEGMVKGIASMAWAPIKAVGDLAGNAIDKAKGILDVFSPSRVFMKIGKFLVDGLTLGIQNNAVAAIRAVGAMVTGQIAMASQYISKYVQKLDQQAIAARAKAEGLTAAAERASTAAGKTEKNKKDDKSSEKLKIEAEKATEIADKAQTLSDKAKEVRDRRDQYKTATTLEAAKMRSEDAQKYLDEAKESEQQAARDLAEARALSAQVKSGKYSKAESDKMRKEAKELRESAEEFAKAANALVQDAKASTSDALKLQKKAGAEAAAAFAASFKAEAKADADVLAFEALSSAEKAAKRRVDAAALQAQANADLAKAKKLAYTDLEAANLLAAKANEEADRARGYLADAKGFEKEVAEAEAEAAAEAAVTAKEKADAAKEIADKAAEEAKLNQAAIDLTASEKAAFAFNKNFDMYDASVAAAAASSTVQFHQYNTSPEALSPTEVYRQTNNLLTYASDKLGKAA